MVASQRPWHWPQRVWHVKQPSNGTLLSAAAGTAAAAALLLLFTLINPSSTHLTARRVHGSAAAPRQLQVPISSSNNLFVLDYQHAYASIYAPNDFHPCPRAGPPASTPCWIPLRKQLDCRSLFKHLLDDQTTLPSRLTFPTPQSIPRQLLRGFKMAGLANLRYQHTEDPEYLAPDAQVVEWRPETFSQNMRWARDGHSFFHGENGVHTMVLYKVLSDFPITWQKGAVFGSPGEPWLEAVLLQYGASHITTIEARKIESTFEASNATTPLDWARGWLHGTLPEVDFAASISQLQREGLGQFGEPLNPWGDVEAMQRASCYVKEGGLMFLSLPTSSRDELTFNTDRLYGPIRWPLMTANWEVLGLYITTRKTGSGLETCDRHWLYFERKLIRDAPPTRPIVVLRNRRVGGCR